MKLLNHTLSYLSVAFFLVIGIWAAIFYFNMLDEIYDSIDDGLENSKILIVQKAQEDSTIIHRTNFMESNYAMHEIKPDHAHRFRDQYLDSTLYMVNEEDYEPHDDEPVPRTAPQFKRSEFHRQRATAAAEKV